MVKYLLQHWHLYQPRENGEWVGKIDSECYKPNSENGILKHVGFNIGPTLLDWLSKYDRGTLENIVSADSGQAMAQPYNHRIMPLCRYDEDIKTQIIWGKKHFTKFFGHEPKGMWLPETATSRRVLKEMAKEGIEYTIGAPWQKKDGYDTTRPYKVSLDDGLEITYLFYDWTSSKIAFNDVVNGTRMLDNADNAVRSIEESIRDDRMMLLAYDGETFGHHHKFADKWAEYFPIAASKIDGLEMLTVPEFLERVKPEEYTDIIDYSSWSCHCGNLSRWITGCGCSGGKRTYQRPLYDAMNFVEDVIHDAYDSLGRKFFTDHWAARNDYIEIMLGDLTWDNFMSRHLKTRANDEKRKELKGILLAEYLTQLSFTSCGWFFSEFGIQSRQNIIDSYNAIITAGKQIPNVMKALPRFYSDISKIEDEVHCPDGRTMHVNGLDELKRYEIDRLIRNNVFVPLIEPQAKLPKANVSARRDQSSLQSFPLA